MVMLEKLKNIEGVKDASLDEAARILTIFYAPPEEHAQVTEMQLKIALAVGTTVAFIRYEAV